MMAGIYAGTGFRGGICTCRAKGGRLKKRYKNLTTARQAADALILDAWVYQCPTEGNIWHTTTKPRQQGNYIYESRKDG